MAPPRMRPRFEIVVPNAPGPTLAAVERRLQADNGPFTGSVLGQHVRLRIGRGYSHTWTPQLDVEVTSHEDGALVRGLYGPDPGIWTLFVAAYAILGFIVLVGVIFGYSQWTIGQPPTALWAVPVALVLAGCVYAVALVGQRLSQAQMVELRGFLDDLLQPDDAQVLHHAAALAKDPLGSE